MLFCSAHGEGRKRRVLNVCRVLGWVAHDKSALCRMLDVLHTAMLPAHGKLRFSGSDTCKLYVVGPPPLTKMTTNQNILSRICRYIHRILHGKGKKGSKLLQYPAKGQFVSNCSRSQVCIEFSIWTSCATMILIAASA